MATAIMGHVCQFCGPCTTVFFISVCQLMLNLASGRSSYLGNNAVFKFNLEFKENGPDNSFNAAVPVEHEKQPVVDVNALYKALKPVGSSHSDESRHKYSEKRRKINNHQILTAQKNLRASKADVGRFGDGEVLNFNPGDPAPSFSIFTLNGRVNYPSENFSKCNIMFHVYDPEMGMMESLWHSEEALVKPLVRLPNNTYIMFLSNVPSNLGIQTAEWMQGQIFHGLKKRLNEDQFKDLATRLHFVIDPVNTLGDWIPIVLKEWMCVDHNCGYFQVAILSPDVTGNFILRRLDAHYDWLPTPENVFNNKTVPLADGGDGCLPSPAVNQSIAYIKNGGCSYFTKVAAMEKSGALGVLVATDATGFIEDMNCVAQECDTGLGIPASMIPGNPDITGDKDVTVYYQNTPSDNFHFAIDGAGKLAEGGWWLYPSMEFLVWEAQWLNYKAELNAKLSQEAMVISVFQKQIMHGDTGVVANITLPPIEKLSQYGQMELDMSLSCPGTEDTTCAHWDQTVQLYLCCRGAPKQLCNMEIGRWISPFRRRVGRWLTDISPLLPLLAGKMCSFNMKTVPWALPWIPSLNLRFSNPHSQGVYPAAVMPLYNPGATFDKNYNTHFKPIHFNVPTDVQKVGLYAVITGHGSDENGCGEFCVTSHHFVVNGNFTANRTFDTAGTPEGCADNVPQGVVANEHGTWLYGRDGWCDGQEVDPWVIDITAHVVHNHNNTVHYYGWFNGTDPNPKENPGLITVWSYLVFYKPLS